jgi:hypothetical protein
MPRDDFTSLERRWRERPLFLPRRRRLPLWPAIIALPALAAGLGWALLDRNQVAGLVAGLEATFDANANQSAAPPNSTAGLSAAAERQPTATGDR